MMKAVEPVKVIEVDGEGLVGMIGKEVRIWCMNYIYQGTLEGVNKTCVKLNPALVVYETGQINGPNKRVEKLRGAAYVQLGAIEIFEQV